MIKKIIDRINKKIYEAGRVNRRYMKDKIEDIISKYGYRLIEQPNENILVYTRAWENKYIILTCELISIEEDKWTVRVNINSQPSNLGDNFMVNIDGSFVMQFYLIEEQSLIDFKQAVDYFEETALQSFEVKVPQ